MSGVWEEENDVLVRKNLILACLGIFLAGTIGAAPASADLWEVVFECEGTVDNATIALREDGNQVATHAESPCIGEVVVTLDTGTAVVNGMDLIAQTPDAFCLAQRSTGTDLEEGELECEFEDVDDVENSVEIEAELLQTP